MNEKTSTLNIFDPGRVLKTLSPQDFLNFGIQDLAYIRRVEDIAETKYIIHAADGTPLSSIDTMELAVVMIRQNELEPVTVH